MNVNCTDLRHVAKPLTRYMRDNQLTHRLIYLVGPTIKPRKRTPRRDISETDKNGLAYLKRVNDALYALLRRKDGNEDYGGMFNIFSLLLM